VVSEQPNNEGVDYNEPLSNASGKGEGDRERTAAGGQNKVKELLYIKKTGFLVLYSSK